MTALKGTDKPPSKGQIHLLADFVELRCASSESGAFSAEELQDVRKRADRDGVEAEEVSIRELFLEDGDELEEAVAVALDVSTFEADELAVAPDDPEVSAEAGEGAQDDVRELEASDVVRHLQYRVKKFGAAYPFRLRDDAVLEVIEDLTPEHQLYLALLVAANLKYVRGKAQQRKLTTYFELLGPDALQGYLGDRAEVELFGTTTDALPNPHYAGTLWDKLITLKDDVSGQIVPTEDLVENAGDYGIDLVAWFPFEGDPEDKIVTILGQCACGRQWPPKMSEPSAQALDEVVRFTCPVVNVLLIPYCYRNADGKWFKRRGFRSGVLLDRERIVQSIRASAADLPIAQDAYPTDFMERILGGEDG